MRHLVILALVLLAGCQQGLAPTVEVFGDSPSKQGWTAPARSDVSPAVDLRHDPWQAEDLDPTSPGFYAAAYAAGVNDWDSARMLGRMETELAGQHRTVVVFNAGIHDASEGVSLVAYRNNLEAAAAVAEQHADYVLWVDSAPDAAPGTFGDTAPYNVVGDQVAAEHGFYRLRLGYPGPISPGIHYPRAVYEALGRQVAEEVTATLAGTAAKG